MTSPDKTTHVTRATYDRIAPKYLTRSCDRGQIRDRLDEFCAHLPTDSLVLDVGCGPGFDTWELRQRGHRAIGVDFSRGMLDIGKDQYPGPYVQADMRRLPLGGTVDGIWACACMLHLPRGDFPLVLAEFARILKPGGYVSLSLKEGEGENWDTRYGDRDVRWFTFWNAADVDCHLRANGFRVIESTATSTRQTSWIRRLARLSIDSSE